jgi:predicted nucleic acid-binding protein
VAEVVFVDSNIPMYLVGTAHPHKVDAQRLLEHAIAAGSRLVTDAEVLQEILHRYTAIDRRTAIQPAFDALLGVVDEVCAVDQDVVERAKRLVLGMPQLSARDAVHLSVMEIKRIATIMTFDAGFDQCPGVRRLAL